MLTLGELVDFVGLPQDSDRLGNPSALGLRRSAACLTTLDTGSQRSMRAVVAATTTLPAITLNAQNVGDTDGGEPFELAIRVDANPGAVLFTELTLFLDPATTEFPAESENFRGSAATFKTGLGPGSWRAVVRRSGVSDTGFVRLESAPFRFHVAFPAPPPPPPPPAPVPPVIDVRSNGDGTFTVNGSGFLPNKPVFISVGVQNVVANPIAVLTDTADTQGRFSSFPTGNVCPASGTPLVFVANDGRIVNGRDLASNVFQISCPA